MESHMMQQAEKREDYSRDAEDMDGLVDDIVVITAIGREKRDQIW